VAELVEKFSSSDYRIDDKLSRLRWIPEDINYWQQRYFDTLALDEERHATP